MNKIAVLLAFLPLALVVCDHGTVSAASSFDPATGTIIDKRWQSGVPLGGIGDGKIELLTDGSFGNFTNQDNWDRPYKWAKGAFAAVRVSNSDGSEPVVRMLRLKSADEYVGVENIAHTRTQGWFPRATIDYSDSALPVTVSLNAFSPLIPHDIKDSVLPVACLNYLVRNTTNRSLRATVLLAWPNLIGWGGRGGVNYDSLEGDSQSAVTSSTLTGLRYSTSQSYSDQNENVVGEDFVGLRKTSEQNVNLCASWDSSATTPSFWNGFVATGAIDNGSDGGENPAGAVSATVSLKPGEEQTLHFYVVWAMPNLLMVDPVQTLTNRFDTASATIPNIDNTQDIRWSTNEGMLPGDNIVLDMGKSCTPSALLLNSGKSNSDYPRGLTVDDSVDGVTWTTVAQKSSDDMFSTSTVVLSPHAARYVRLTNLGQQGLFWSIYGLALKVQESDAPVEPVSAVSNIVHADIKVVSDEAGRYWQNYWPDSLSMAEYIDEHEALLLQQTRAWQDPVLKSNVPFWLKLKLINCAFPMFSNTVLTKAGQFSVLESPIDMGGALGTMDQRMAAHAFLTAFFPELDRTELEQYATCQQTDGRITHFDGNVNQVIVDPNVGYGVTDWPDLSCGWVSQVAKLYRWTGDKTFLDRMLPHVSSAMTWLKNDGADDELIPAGGSTYDYETLPRGAFIYSASCYLGALRAASAVSEPSTSAEYDALTTRVQQSVMKNLWTGTYFRKWRQPSTGRTVDDSFISNLAGDWFTHITGLPSTLPANIVHQSIAQTIARHQKPFFPMPPMQVTAAGKMTTSNCYSLQHEPYLGCEAIYGNYVDDGLETIRRIYFAVWEENHSPWDESLCYDSSSGQKGGLPTYMTCPTTWFVLDALSGASLDVPAGRLYISPRLTSEQSELHIPIYFSRFWANLDYVPAKHMLSMTVSNVYQLDEAVEQTLYHASGAVGDTMPAIITIRSIAADGDSRPILLSTPFVVRPGAILDLSAYIGGLHIPHATDKVNFEVKADVHRPGLPSANWKLTDNLHDSSDIASIFGQNALDGNEDTRWTTGRSLVPGDAVTLDMATVQRVGRLVLDSAKSPGDFPEGYTLEGSVDGIHWSSITQATPDQVEKSVLGGVLTISFSPVRERYLRVTSTGGHSLYWSIHELYAYPE